MPVTSIRSILEEDFTNRPFVWTSELSDMYYEKYGICYANNVILEIISQFPDWEIDKCECTNPIIYRKINGIDKKKNK